MTFIENVAIMCLVLAGIALLWHFMIKLAEWAGHTEEDK